MSEKKTAVITGASSGLGRAMARKFKDSGYYVVAVSRKVPEDGVCDCHIAADLTDKDSLEKAAQEILKLEKVDVFVGNHAGQNQTPERYQRLLEGDKNAFLDPTAWGKFLDKCEAELNRLETDDPL